MPIKQIINYDKSFISPIDSSDFEYLKSQDLSYYNQKFLNYYLRSFYPDNCILSGLEPYNNTTGNNLSFTITKGVVIADKSVICITDDILISDNVTNLPTNIKAIVYLYQYWKNTNRYQKPEIHINYVNAGTLYDNSNIDISKGFILLGAYDIIHDQNSIQSIVKLESIVIDSVDYKVNKINNSSSGSNNSIQYTTESHIVNETDLIQKQIQLSNNINTDYLNNTNIIILTSNSSSSSPELYYQLDFNIILPNIISWSGYELESLIELNEIIRTTYVLA